MDEISKAAMKRFKSAFGNAGLELRTTEGKIDSPAVRLWLYSCHYDLRKGVSVRLVSQVSADTYRRMQTKDGLEPLLDKRTGVKELSAGDALLAGIEAYDENLALRIETEEMRQLLTLLMCRYAYRTKTWAMAPSLSDVEGLHFFLLDWLVKDHQTLRPAMMSRAGVLSADDTKAFSLAVLEQHFRMHPEDRP